MRSATGERLSNARILLVHAVEEIESETRPDLYELGLAVSATAETFIALRHASRRLGVDPPDLADLRPWALTLFDQATRPRPRRFPRWWPGRASGPLP
jgi:hypothetical protein